MRNFVTGCVAGRFVFGCVAALTAVIIGLSAPSAIAAPSRDNHIATEISAKKNTSIRSSSSRQVRVVRKSSRHVARSTRGKSKVALAKQAGKTADANLQKQSGEANALSAAVANANAEMIEGEAAPEAKSDQAPEVTVAARDAHVVVASDQINDIDRAAMATPRPRTINASFEMRDETDFTQTSLIGRIFIAIGALLTIGSAVRMVMS